MEVEQVLPITSKVDDITNGNDDIIPGSISMEEEEHVNGAAETNDAAEMIATVKDEADGDDKMIKEEPVGISISRSASSNGRRQQAKKRGEFGLFRAMFMSFSGSASMKKRGAAAMVDQKKASAAGSGSVKLAATAAVARSSSDVASWKNLVDGMRPLRLYGEQEYYPPPPPLGHDVYHDVLLPPPSPDRPDG